MRSIPPRIRPYAFSVTTASHLFLLRNERAEDADRQSTVVTLCDGALSAPTFNLADLLPLMCKRLFPDAIKRLLKLSGAKESLVKAFYNTVAPQVAPFRFAQCFIDNVSYETTIFTANHLREMKGVEAQCALAAMGEIDWIAAPVRVRATFALRAMIGKARP